MHIICTSMTIKFILCIYLSTIMTNRYCSFSLQEVFYYIKKKKKKKIETHNCTIFITCQTQTLGVNNNTMCDVVCKHSKCECSKKYSKQKQILFQQRCSRWFRW